MRGLSTYLCFAHRVMEVVETVKWGYSSGAVTRPSRAGALQWRQAGASAIKDVVLARQDPIQTPAERSPNLPLSGPTIPYEYAASEPLEALLAEEARRAPSLPIVLLSAASGLGMALFGFYAAYGAAHLSLELSAGVATLLLCLGIGVPGALLSWATGSRAALPNIGLSCGLVVLALSFLASCAILGALTATILIAARL